MNVEIYLKMIPKEDIRISIYPIPIHLSPVSEMELTAAKCPLYDTEKRQKICDAVICLCHGSFMSTKDYVDAVRLAPGCVKEVLSEIFQKAKEKNGNAKSLNADTQAAEAAKRTLKNEYGRVNGKEKRAKH